MLTEKQAEGNSLFIRGLPPSATGESLEQFFSIVGPIRRAFVVTNGAEQTKCTGVGFVHFALREDAKKALNTLQSAAFGGRRLHLHFAKRRHRTSDDTVQASINDDTVDADGGLRKKRPRAEHLPDDIVSAHRTKRVKASHPQGALLGSAAMRTVVVKCRNESDTISKEQLLQAMGAANDKEAGLESILVAACAKSARCVFRSWALAGSAAARIHGFTYDTCIDALRGGRRCRLIVRNLPFDVDPSEFEKPFREIAPVREFSLPQPKEEEGEEDNSKDTTTTKVGKEKKKNAKRCRGFGFVEYFLVADANRAIAKVNGSKIGGRVVAVDLAIGKTQFINKSNADEQQGSDIDEAAAGKDKAFEESGIELEEEKDEQPPGVQASRLETTGVGHGDDGREGSTTHKRRRAKVGATAETESVDGLHTGQGSAQAKRPVSTPEEMERTVFIRNLLYETSATELWQAMEQRFGKIEQAVVVKDPLTGRSRGSAFVRFATREQATEAVSVTGPTDAERGNVGVPGSTISLQGRTLLIARATDRERARDLVQDSSKKKDRPDPRNMRLAWIGHIKPDSAEAHGMSEADFAKRAKAEKEKKAKLSKNPNTFVSETRLSVRNLPKFVDEKILKQLFLLGARYDARRTSNDKASETVQRQKGPSRQPRISHTKILRDAQRNDRSRGYGFVQFEEHRHALQALHRLNNNPSALDMLLEANPRALELNEQRKQIYRKEWGARRRLIVEFSVEDKRQVRILEGIKERGRAKREASCSAKAANSDAVARVRGKTEKRQRPATGEKSSKRRKRDLGAPEQQPVADSKGTRLDEKRANMLRTARGNTLRTAPDGKTTAKTEYKKKKRDARASQRKRRVPVEKDSQRPRRKNDEGDDKFESLVNKYKKKLERVGGQKWLDATST